MVDDQMEIEQEIEKDYKMDEEQIKFEASQIFQKDIAELEKEQSQITQSAEGNIALVFGSIDLVKPYLTHKQMQQL